MTKTVTALFDRYEDAAEAVGELERVSITDISIMSRNGPNSTVVTDTDDDAAVGAGAGIGAVLGGATGLLAGLGMLAVPGLGPVVAAGWLASTAAGVGAGAVVGAAGGGLLGGLTSSGIPEEEAHVYAESVRRGGTLVTARVPEVDIAAANLILKRKGVDFASRSQSYRETGWTRFDETQPPNTPGEVEHLDTYR